MAIIYPTKEETRERDRAFRDAQKSAQERKDVADAIGKLEAQGAARALKLVTLKSIALGDDVSFVRDGRWDEDAEHDAVCAELRYLQEIERLARVMIGRQRAMLIGIDRSSISSNSFAADRALMHALDKRLP